MSKPKTALLNIQKKYGFTPSEATTKAAEDEQRAERTAVRDQQKETFSGTKAMSGLSSLQQKYGFDNGGTYSSQVRAEKGVGTWASGTNSLLQRLGNDFTEREGTYHTTSEFAEYQTARNAEIDAMLDRSSSYRDYFSENRSLYGDDVVDEILAMLDEGDRYLNDARTGLQSEHDYWAQFDNERVYNEFLRGQEYAELANADDFELYSGQGAALENPSLDDVEKGVTIFGKNFGGEKPQNIVTYSRDNYFEIGMGEMNNSQMTGRSLYHYMTEDEVDIYNYLLARDGEDVAQEYLDYLEETLNYRHGTGVAERVQAIENPFGNFAAHGFMSLAGGLDQFTTGVRQTGNAIFGDGDALPTSSMAFTNQALLEDLEGLGKYAYSAGNTVGNMLPSILIGTMSGGAGLATLGVSAGGNAYGQAIEEGYSRGQALAYGTAVGASEALLTKALGGISALRGNGSMATKLMGKVSQFDSALARVTLGGAVSIGSEITEEELQLWLEPVFRMAIFGEEFDGPNGQEMLETAIITALSTFALEAGPTVVNDARTTAAGREFNSMNLSAEDISAFVEEGLASDPSTQSYQYATRLKAKLESGGALTNYELGRMYQLNAQDIQSEEDGSKLLEQAAQEVANGGKVTNRMASAILGNVNAVNTLVRETGTTLTNDMSKSQRRAAVKSAVRSLASPSGATQAQETSADTSTERNTAVKALDTRRVKELTQDMSKATAETFRSLYDGSVSAEEYFPAMNAYYRAGLNGEDAASVEGYDVLTKPQREAAYLAGQMERNGAVANSGEAVYTNPNDNLEMEVESDGEEGTAGSGGEQQWAHRVSAPERGGGVYLRAGSTQTRGTPQGRRAQSIRAAVDAQGLQEVSTASLGISTGTTRKTLKVVPSSLWTDEMRNASREQAKSGRQVIYFTGELEVSEGGKSVRARGAISADGKRIWVRADHERLSVEQILKHEEFHAKVKADPALLERVRKQVTEKYSDAELTEMVNAYIDEYGYTNVSNEYILEEILADAYGGIDIFDYLTDYEGATRFSETTREAAASSEEGGGNEIRGPTEEKLSRDEAERRRALRKGEMVNEFRDKINWASYYQKIMTAEYNPDFFDDGSIAKMELGNTLLTLQMQRNGEWSVIRMEAIDDEGQKRGRTGRSGRDGEHGLSGERDHDSHLGDERSRGQRGGTERGGAEAGERSDGAGDGAVRTADDGEVKLSAEPTSLQEQINQSMTMAQAKQMVQRAFVLGNIKEWFDGEYKNGDEWLRGEGAADVALIVENEYSLQSAYLDRIPGILNEDFFVEDMLEAYAAGTLTGKVAKKAAKADLSSSVEVADNRFYAPQAVENARALYETANQRVTKSNRSEVMEARAQVLLYAHNKGAAETLGLTEAELNKKLRSWSNYSAKARDISLRINAGIPAGNRWTGIENMAYVNQARIDTDEVARMVKEVQGRGDAFQNRYIARTMMALDTHIDWSWLTIRFDTYEGVNRRGNTNTSSGKCNGYYLNSDRLIHCIENAPNTVAHEMGHALDYQWARELGLHGALTEAYRNTERVTGKAKEWFDRFKDFTDTLVESSDIGSAYSGDIKETFARFVARFIEWTETIGTGRSSVYERSYYNDKFTQSQYIAFARLLQEKAALDAGGYTENRVGDVKLSVENEGPDANFYDASVKLSREVTDRDTLEFLDGQDTITTYKTMQLVDGKLYPPMASRIDGQYEDASTLGTWEQATEHPELIRNGNKFKLDKGKGQGSIEAAYNPYMHSSNLVLNDQFSGAYKRDNLVTVECEVPVSEATSGYRAEFAKDAVGWHPWHTGTVAGQLRKATGTERQVFLSRWIKPVRIVPDAEVAAMYKELLDGTGIAVPDNVVTPSLLSELRNAGVDIEESGRVKFSRELDAIKSNYADETDHLYLHEKADGTISIDNMVVKKALRNQGVGTQILTDIISYADATGKTITLTPTSEFGTKARLTKWYKEHGFVENKGRNADYRLSDTMYRLPRSKYSRELESLSDLREQNEALREKMDYWKGQTKRTTAESRTVRKGDVEKLAKRLIKGYDSTLEAKDITADLQALGDFLVRGGDGKNELTWADVKDRAVSIARDIVQSAEVLVEDGEAELYREIKSRLRKQRIAFNDQSDIADYGDFRKRNMGKFILAKDGLPIDVLWMELNDAYGESYFPSDIIHPADQLMHLADLLDGMEPIYENPFSYYMAEATEYLANDIIDSLISEDIRQTPPTFADRQAAKLDAQKAKDRQRLDRLRQQKNERIAEIRKQGQERTKEALRKVRADRDAKIKELKAHFRTKDAKARESRKATALRAKIQKHVKALSGELLRPSDKHHVPEALRGPVARLLEAINLESGYDLEYGKEAIYHKVERGTPGAEATERTKAFAELKQAYTDIAGEIVVDPDLLGDDGLLTAVIAMAGKPIANMNSTELETIWQTIRAVEASIRTANKMFAAARFATVTEAAEALRRDNEGKKAFVTLAGPGGVLGKGQTLAGLDMMTPETFLHLLGDSGDAIFRMMRGAQDEHIRIMKAVADFTHEALGKVNVNALEKELHTVKLGGEDVKLSTAQLMELYVLMRREQAVEHIMVGGILPDTVVRNSVKADTKLKPLRGVTLEEVTNAIGLLSPEQVAIAERLQDYASKELSDYGNRASMEVYNYKKFTEEHYWPIRSNRQEVQSDVSKDSQKATSVANRGFTKAIKPKANNSVRLGSIFDTFATHASEMATYAAWLGTTEDINRIRNYTFRDGEGKTADTVKGIIDHVHGSHGSAYFQKLLEDIANGVKGTHGETKYLGGLTSNYKAASVGANLRVIIQQPTAILRAMDMLAPQYLVAGMKPSGGWKKALKYAPIAQWKDWGYFDINTGRQMKDVLFDSDSVLQKIKSVSMWGAGKMDSAAWGMLWNAVETETRAKHKELKPGTKEYYDHVAARFTEIVDRTQVVDGILQRSQIMRKSDSLTKMMTSFMGEPTKQYNMLLASAYDARHATSKEHRTAAKKRLARTAFALSVSGIVNAAAQSIMDALRDDEKEKGYWERWLSAFTGITGEEETFGEALGNAALSGNLGSTFNIAGYIPVAKDLLSMARGYDVSRMDMEAISGIVDAATNLLSAMRGDSKYSIAGASANLFVEMARAFGIPVANLKRDIWVGATEVMRHTGSYGLRYHLLKVGRNFNHTTSSSEVLKLLYEAMCNDPEAYEYIKRDLIETDALATDTKGTAQRIRDNMKSKYNADVKAGKTPDVPQNIQDDIGITRTYSASAADEDKSFGESDLSSAQFERYNSERADTYREIVDAFEGYPGWSGMDTEMKDKLVSAAASLAKETALADNSSGQYTVDTKWMQWATGGASSGVDEAEAILFKAAYDMTGGDKDKNGNTISGSKKENVLELVDDLMPWLTDDELRYLMSNFWKE